MKRWKIRWQQYSVRMVPHNCNGFSNRICFYLLADVTKKSSSIRCHSTAQTMTYNIVFWEKEALNQLWYTDDERQKRVCVCIKLVYYSDFVFSSSHLTLWFNKKTSYSIVFKVVNMLPCIVCITCTCYHVFTFCHINLFKLMKSI